MVQSNIKSGNTMAYLVAKAEKPKKSGISQEWIEEFLKKCSDQVCSTQLHWDSKFYLKIIFAGDIAFSSSDVSRVFGADWHTPWTHNGTTMVGTKREIFKICASRYSKNAFPGRICS